MIGMALGRTKGRLAALLAGTAAFFLSGGNAFAFGLFEAYEEALKNDPVYQSAVHENEAGKQYRAMGRSFLLPTIAINHVQYKNKADIEGTNIFGQSTTTHPEYDSRVSSLSIRQPVFNLEGVARYQQGTAQTNYSDSVFKGRSQELMIRVAEAYMSAKYAEEQLALTLAQRDAFLEQMRVNRRMFELGEGTKTDMLETQAKAELAEAEVIEARDNLVRARNVLVSVTGRNETHLRGLSQDFRTLPLKPKKFEEWERLAANNNTELNAQRFAVEAALQEHRRNQAGHAPRLDLVANYNDNKSDSVTTIQQESRVTSVGLQLSIPLFSGGYVSAAATQAAANHMKAKSELNVKTNQVMIELHKQYSLVHSSVSRIDALNKAVESARLLITATQKSIAGGARINLDLLSAQHQLYTAKKDLAQARFKYLLAYLRLRYTAGVLSTEDFRHVANYFTDTKFFAQR